MMRKNSALFNGGVGVVLGLSVVFFPFVKAEGLFLTPRSQSVRNPFPPETAYVSPSLNSRGIALEAIKQGQPHQALVLLESWVDDHPEDLDAFSYLAKINYTLGDFVGMRRYLAILKTLAPQDMVTQKTLAWASTIPESKAPTEEDEKNKVLLNLARSVAEEKESQPHFGSSFLNTQATKKVPSEASSFQAKTVFEDKKASLEAKPLPVVKETWVDENTRPTVADNTAKHRTKQDVKAVTPSTSTVGAAASLQASTSTTPLTQEEIAQNFQMLQQLMMMQMMNNSQNGMNPNNPMAMMLMNGQGLNGMNGSTMMNPALNPQMMNQMMQNSLLNNMNGMFNTNTDNQTNHSGLGF
jgi:hypothetical protein